MKDNEIKDIDYDKLNVVEYQEHYSEKGFLDKIKSIAKSAGDKILYYALLLYYMMISDQVSIKNKGLICGALGYFILPTDLIPDFILALGFTDDLAVIMLVYKAIKSSITLQIEERAKQRLKELKK